jgi:flagellar biosynthesis chaperone FliJ
MLCLELIHGSLTKYISQHCPLLSGSSFLPSRTLLHQHRIQGYSFQEHFRVVVTSTMETGILQRAPTSDYALILATVDEWIKPISFVTKAMCTPFIVNDLKQLFRLAARTTDCSNATDEVKQRLDFYLHLLRRSSETWKEIQESIESDLKEGSMLRQCIAQGLQIEAHESQLQQEETMAKQRKQLLEETRSHLLQNTKKIQRLESMTARADRKMADLRLDIEHMKWSANTDDESDGQSESSYGETVYHDEDDEVTGSWIPIKLGSPLNNRRTN